MSPEYFSNLKFQGVYGSIVGTSTVFNILSETLPAIWNALQPLVLVPPDAEGWKKEAKGFEHKWNFPNCIGGIDGKHVTIQAPPHAGSSYYNYEGRHSLVSMAVVDYEYCFILMDVGAQGRQNDGGISRNSVIGHKLVNKSLDVPPPQVVFEGRLPLPFVIVGDAAFPLLENLLTPYPGITEIDETIYNYRHSRAKRVSENALGILVVRWRIFSRTIIAKIENVDSIIKAAVCLHNFVICYDKNISYITLRLVNHERGGVIVSGTWREGVSQLTSVREPCPYITTRNARDIRDQFKEYYNEEGAVPWQWNHL